eukprot:3874994-Amphidinium_carterae.1
MIKGCIYRQQSSSRLPTPIWAASSARAATSIRACASIWTRCLTELIRPSRKCSSLIEPHLYPIHSLSKPKPELKPHPPRGCYDCLIILQDGAVSATQF